ncbi:MAG TPA: cyclic 2,3-diphosphoglycerate synthase [Candidatus Kapabacteria bacterium]|jgi:predicted GTPase|nr:cyclic 2,3-diphosphoglycerate synthase [Candidatus Kapabacteria bacterium]
MATTARINTIIVGAAGRDFHNFNMYYRGNERYNVVAFTAAQIPDIAGRRYPAALAGDLYPNGIPIHEQKDLEQLIDTLEVDEVVFSYSDVSYQTVMSIGSRVMAAGASFVLLSPEKTMVRSTKPVISVCAVRTGAGKSQTTRKVARLLQGMGLKVVAIRHPMPYGDLEKQRVQRFATLEDLKLHDCTIEEMEEYEPHIVTGTTIYAGVDYAAILAQAEQEADVILWDGGNNDLPFYKPDLHIVVADPLRVGDELEYFPSEANLRMANVVIINKIDSAEPKAVLELRRNIWSVNPTATIIDAASPIVVENAASIAGKRVLVVEDGPTLTHGDMKFGAGTVAALKFGAAEIVDPREYAVGTIARTFEIYPEIGTLLPAMGYGEQQMKDLEQTIAAVPCDVVIVGTPIDLKRIITIDKPALRVGYDLQEIGEPNLMSLLTAFVDRVKPTFAPTEEEAII